MAVKLVSTFTQWVGVSSDTKPNVGIRMPDGTILTAADLQPGATFLELDTGFTSKYDGANWQRIPTDGAQVVMSVGVMVEAVQAMHRTLESLRQGLINANNCDDVNPVDVSGTPAELVS
jgi:hypothetical protein